MGPEVKQGQLLASASHPPGLFVLVLFVVVFFLVFVLVALGILVVFVGILVEKIGLEPRVQVPS